MTATQRFIEDAIKGGWDKNRHPFPPEDIENYTIEKILLDPHAWQAVGKMRGWKEYQHEHLVTKEKLITKIWLEQWHTFIDHLADGKSIEDSLAEISKQM